VLARTSSNLAVSQSVDSEDSTEKTQRSGTQAEEPLPVKTVKCSPGVMVYCSVYTVTNNKCNFYWNPINPVIVGQGYQPGCIILRVGNLAD
jgi:hypothetical protein